MKNYFHFIQLGFLTPHSLIIMEKPRPSEPEPLKISPDFPQRKEVQEAVRSASKVEMGESAETFVSDEKKFKKAVESCTRLYDTLLRIKRKTPEIQRLIDLSSAVIGNAYSIEQFAAEIKSGKSGKSQLSPEDVRFRQAAVRECHSNLEEALDEISGISIEESKTSYGKPMSGARKYLTTLVVLASTLVAGSVRAPEAEPKKEDTTEQIEAAKRRQAEGGGEEPTTAFESLREESEHNPSIAGEGGPGEFGKENPLATIDFESTSTITEPLWVTHYTKRTDQGYRRLNLDSQVDFSRPGSVEQATVVMEKINAPRRSHIALPVPPGYYISSVEWEKPNENVSCTSRGLGQGLFFGEEVKGLTVKYKVSSTTAPLKLKTKEHYLPNIPRDDAEKKLVDELKKPDAPVEKLLSDHLRKFTYVVSADLQDIFDKIKGFDPEEITGATRLGNCDTLSNYSAGLVNEAGKNSAVANGFLENSKGKNKGIIDQARSHAKMLHFENGKPVLFESTAATKGAYVNVVFSGKDKETLESRVAGLNANAQTGEGYKALEEFGKKVTEILAKPEYQKFRFHGRPGDFVGEPRTPESGGMTDIMRSLYKFEAETKDFATEGNREVYLGIAICLLLIGGLGAAEIWLLNKYGYIIGKMVDKIKGKIKEKTRGGREETMLATAEYVQNELEGNEAELKPGETDKSKEESMDLLARFYKTYPKLEKIMSTKKVGQMAPEARRRYLQALAMNELLVGKDSDYGVVTNFVYSIFRNPRWIKQLERAKADGLDVRSFIHSLRKRFENEELVEREKQRIPEIVKGEIIQSGKLLDSVSSDALKKAGQLKPSDILGMLKLENTSFEQQQRQKGEGTEFDEHLRYTPGEDVRRIDWKVTARSGSNEIFMKKTLEERGARESLNLRIAVDVIGSDSDSISRLGALLLYAQRSNGKVQIEEIRFMAGGETLEVFGKEKVLPLIKTGGAANPEGASRALSALFTKIENMRVENSLQFMRRADDSPSYFAHRALRGGLPVLKKGEKLVMIGEERVPKGDTEMVSSRELVAG